MLTATTKMMKLVRVQAVAVVSVLSLVAAFLVSGVMVASSAQAAAVCGYYKNFTLSGGTFEDGTTWSQDTPAVFVDGNGSVSLNDGTYNSYSMGFTNSKAALNTIVLGRGPYVEPLVLTGANWGPYSGTSKSPFGGTEQWSGFMVSSPSNFVEESCPTPDVSKPRAPKSVTVAGTSTSKSFKVSWKKPSTKGDRPVAGYRVLVNQKGYKNNFVDKKLSKKTLSYKISRSTLLKNAVKRSRGEVGGTLRFRVRIFATNDAGNGEPVTSWIRVAA